VPYVLLLPPKLGSYQENSMEAAGQSEAAWSAIFDNGGS
jgi:hypothetical protein